MLASIFIIVAVNLCKHIRCSDYNLDDLAKVYGSSENGGEKNLSDIMVGDDPHAHKPSLPIVFPENNYYNTPRYPNGRPPDTRGPDWREPPRRGPGWDNPNRKEPPRGGPGWREPDRTEPYIPSNDVDMFGDGDEDLSIDLMSMIDQTNDVDEFLQRYTTNGGPRRIISAGFSIQSRFGGDVEASVERPALAKCAPVDTLVSLKPNNPIPGHLYVPPCTRVPRCEGCSNMSGKTCEPTKIQNITYGLAAMKVNQQLGNGVHLTYIEEVTITIETHRECKLTCKIKPEDCPSTHIFREQSCRCVCANRDELMDCKKLSDPWRWDSSTCRCTQGGRKKTRSCC